MEAMIAFKNKIQVAAVITTTTSTKITLTLLTTTIPSIMLEQFSTNAGTSSGSQKTKHQTKRRIKSQYLNKSNK